MPRLSKLQFGFGKLEGALLIAFAALVFQLFPSLWFDLWSLLDFRTWPRAVWFALNILVLVALFALRFAPGLYANWQERRKRTGKAIRRTATVGADESPIDPEYEARFRRDAEWRERAKKRLPWHS